MPLEHTTLVDFVQQAWTLTATTMLAEALQQIQQWSSRALDAPSTDRVVIVDDQHRAIGLLSMAQLLAKLYCAESPAQSEDTLLPLAQGLLHPILPLAANLNPQEFWQQWQALPDATEFIWGVVDPNSEAFLGLLDWPRLQQALTPTPDSEYAAPQSQFPPSCTSQALAALVNLIELLPTPLLLQLGDGQVLARNLAWRQQVDPMISPAQIALNSPQGGAGGSAMLWGQCHQGEVPNSLICTYSLQDDQEQIWQFYKVPITSLAGAQTGVISPDGAMGAMAADQPWTLAAPPDPAPAEASIPTPELTELWVTQAQDVTDTHHLVPELQAKNADLMLLNSLNEDFLAELSHDIKTPLTALVGLSNVLQEKRLGPLTPRQAKYLQIIYQKSQQLMLIMNDLLDLTQIRTQRLTLHPELVNIYTLCQEAITQALRRQHIEQGIPHTPDRVISVDIDPELTEVIADPARLRQSLVLMLCQALELTSDSGQIGLRVSHWGRWIAWTVWDTGMSIPIAQQHLLFQTPVVFEASPTKFYQTRLSLILARRLAQLQGGDVSFLSMPPHPNQLTLLLPAQRSQTPPAAPPSPLSPLVLVVAAVPRLIADLHQILGELEAQVVVARSGPEALEKSRQLLPDLIFLHLPLPYISGWDVLTLLKRDGSTRAIPVVVIGEVSEFQQTRFDIGEPLSLPLQRQAVQASFQRWGLSTATPPPQDQPSRPVPPSPPTGPALRKAAMTILHLEDLASSQGEEAWHHETQISHYLHRQGCRVIAATDVEQAELLANIWRPQVVLYTSPRPQLLANLEHHSPLSQLPFVVLHSEVMHQMDPGLRLNVFLVPLGEGWNHGPASVNTSLLLETVKAAAELIPR